MPGLCSLIDSEWIQKGHMFRTRNGLIPDSDPTLCSPIFRLFMDCMWQIVRRFPVCERASPGSEPLTVRRVRV